MEGEPTIFTPADNPGTTGETALILPATYVAGSNLGSTDLESTDDANDARGAAREGEVLPPPSPVQSNPVSLASGDEVLPDNTFYAAKPLAVTSASVLPDAAPVGWVRDADGDLHDASGIVGLKIEQDNLSGHTRYLVRAHCAMGIVTLSSHTGDRALAETHREAIALVISEAKGLIEYADEPEDEMEEVMEEAKTLTRGKLKK